MLSKLSIKNFALIDNIEINFDRKLNIITGETGAGKSIIIGALSLLLGQRAESKYFFNQQKKCVIEGNFTDISTIVKQFLVDNDLDVEEDTILRREIAIDGKTRSFINDTPVNLTFLKTIGEKLIDIHSQHAILELNNPEFQIMVLDSMAKQNPLISEYQGHYNRYKQTLKKLEELSLSKEKSTSEIDYFQFLYNELEQANIVVNEQHELEKELSKLSNAEEIKKNLSSAEFIINTQEQSILFLTKTVIQSLQQVEKFMPETAELSDRLNSCYIELKDISNEISSLNNDINIDENKIIKINERLSLIYQLNQKHHVNDGDELSSVKDNLLQKLSASFNNDETISQLEKEKINLFNILTEQAELLSKNREAIVEEVETKVISILKEMGLNSAKFKVSLQTTDEFTKFGLNKVEFLFSANAGQNLNTLSKIASGGELSRFMLALKSLIAKNNSLPTIIFDEIDTGISGEIAQKVGKIMRNLSNDLQVISITHLPQIAVQGNTHLYVYKNNSSVQAQTNIKILSAEEREIEIAKMLSGDNYSNAALLNARDLLKN